MEANAINECPAVTITSPGFIFPRRLTETKLFLGKEKKDSESPKKTFPRLKRWTSNCLKRLELKLKPIRTNEHFLIFLRIFIPIFTRVTIVLIWFALIYAVFIPSGEEHGFFKQQTNNSASQNLTNLVLNNSLVNTSTFQGMYNLSLFIQSQSEYLSVALHRNSKYFNLLNYKLDLIPFTSDQNSGGILSDLSGDPLTVISLSLLVICSSALGYLFRIIRLPPLLGMLLAGIVFTHITFLWGILPQIPRSVSSTLRSIALVVILVRGGLGINPSKLRARACQIIRLATVPCIGEAVFVAIATFLILGFKTDYWYWAAMSGCTVAAVSPAIVLPQMLQLQNKGYGTERGIPTMVIASSSFDDVLAISLFFVFLTLAFSTSDLAFTILRGPLELFLGLVYGIVIGIIGRYISMGEKQGSVNRNRVMYLFGGAMLAILGSNAIIVHGSSLGGAGAIGVVSSALVCSLSWKNEKMIVELSFKIIWELAQPILFGIIGYEINFLKEGFDPILIAKIIAIIILGLVARCIFAFLSVACVRDFFLKEKLFIPIAWLPKATVQAAIGSLALDAATNETQLYLGKVVLYIAVFSILITAPLGAILINLLGTVMIKKDLPSDSYNTKRSVKSIETAITDVSDSSKDSHSSVENKGIPGGLQNGNIQVNNKHNSTL